MSDVIVTFAEIARWTDSGNPTPFTVALRDKINHARLESPTSAPLLTFVSSGVGIAHPASLVQEIINVFETVLLE